MRKVLLGLVGTVIVIAGVAFLALRFPVVQDRLLERLVTAGVSSPGPDLVDPDALNVIVCGSGGPFPDVDRAGPCTLVVAGGKSFLVDSGAGGVQRLGQLRVPLGSLQAIFYTHLHSDHIAGLGDAAFTSWGAGRTAALTLYGPPGVEELAAGVEAGYRIDSKARIDHHGPEIFAPAAQAIVGSVVRVPTRDDLVVVYDDGDLKVTAFRVSHVPLENAYGYRFDYKGRSVVFSGDTVRDENVARFGAGADLMVHEAMGMANITTIIHAMEANNVPTLPKILRDAMEVHTSPVDAAEIANQAGVSLLVYSHIVPPMPVSLMEDRFMRGVDEVRPEGVMLGYDGLLVRLPVGSSSIGVEDLR